MKEQKKRDKVTIGLDLGDRRRRFCVLGCKGEVVEEGSLLNERVQLSELVGRYPGALVVMEAGCHSPWISRYLEGLGCEAVVSNPRKVRAIYQHERKSDRRDALMLARIARMEPALLYPVEHGSQEAQQDLLCIMWRSTGGNPVYSNTRQRKGIMTPEDANGKRFAVVAIFAHPRG